MEYNTQRKKMELPEYGRSVQNMVDHALTIEDREERQRCANTIVNIMGGMFPHLRDIPDFKRKLWDHLAIMSDFKLDIDYPFEVVKKEDLIIKPETIAYPNGAIRYRHYGGFLEELVKKAVEIKDEVERKQLINLLAIQMKKSLNNWNKEGAEDQKIVDDLKTKDKVMVFIDEIHTLVGAGKSSGAMDAANILKPALARGELRTIGATTLDEYQKYFEQDKALERRFQKVLVDEPTREDAVSILRGLKERYEGHHKVRIKDEAIVAAVELSHRYITDRFLPDKAIDIIDEASSKVNLSNERLIELADLKLQLAKINQDREETLDDDYQKKADLKAAECRITDRIFEIETSDISKEVSLEDVTEVVQLWTNIPVKALTEVDSSKLLNLEDQLHESVIGQDKAVDAIARAVRRKRAGINIKKRPVSFIFVGPTGVGKTELVKTLARSMFGSEGALIRLDMSEYMEKHSVSKLIGSPPGYVGYDEAGQLTEKIRRNPYSVILLDEIEKAHADVFNIFLQVLDDGRITDSQGRTINFENTVIIMTSNAGSDLKSGSMGFESYASEGRYEKALSQLFRPEFLNRVDEIIEFDYLTQEDLIKITELILSELAKGLAEKNITMTVSDSAKELIVKKGYDKKFGARPIRRVILREIEDIIASKIISGEIKEGRNICIDSANNNFVII